MPERAGAAANAGATVVLVGAGHTHVELLLQGHRFTEAGLQLVVVSPEPAHPYSGMGPGLLGGTYSVADISLPIGDLAARTGARFVQQSVVSHNPQSRTLMLADGSALGYDLVSFNVGSEVPADAGRSAVCPVIPVKPIAGLAAAREVIEAACRAGRGARVAIVGGGPAGVELAGNVAWLLATLGAPAAAAGAESRVDLYASDRPLAGLSGRRQRYVERCLKASGVRVHHGQRVDVAALCGGAAGLLPSPPDLVLLATGIGPPRALDAFGLPCAPDGAILVDRYLRAQGAEHVFAVGDCASFAEEPLDRVGVYAVRMQRVLLRNLLATAAGTPLQPFTATGPYLGGLNLGFGRGILYRGPWTLRGRPAFRAKDWIDRRFVRRYQRPVA
ncbi:MAG: pyridine nucleotide-disulfide oxidoreductase [Spirochaetaceae bacterium]|nr:MAG: pyridine nucleotide-disulfide oxidoreductase [Spirochaetaceae bacterium]